MYYLSRHEACIPPNIHQGADQLVKEASVIGHIDLCTEAINLAPCLTYGTKHCVNHIVQTAELNDVTCIHLEPCMRLRYNLAP